jgi:quercetin dioxygenase-like cupin family protein
VQVAVNDDGALIPKTDTRIVGPLPIVPSSSYAAEYLCSILNPGATAPLHVHSGPETFIAVSGDISLETPDGMRTRRGPGNNLTIEAGPPMLLMAIGKVPRQGLRLSSTTPESRRRP